MNTMIYSSVLVYFNSVYLLLHTQILHLLLFWHTQHLLIKQKLLHLYIKSNCMFISRNYHVYWERKSEREIIPLCNTLLVMCMKCLHRIKVYIYLSGNWIMQREREREREREWPVPNSRWAFERSVTCLYLENRFSIVLIVYVLFGCIHRLCPYKHIFLFFWRCLYRCFHVSAIGQYMYMYCRYYAWVLFDGILLSAGLCIVQYSLSWKIFDY